MGGLFISFEGIDGSGKSTQARLLYDWLVSLGRPALLCREPGGTRIGEALRAIIIDRGNSEMTAEAEALLFAAARSQIVAEVIRPALEAGKIVVCDRFLDSSIVYQGIARGLGIDAVSRINVFAAGRLMPDVTFFIDIAPNEVRARALSEPDRLEAEGFDFQNKLYQGYLTLAGKFGDRIVSVDGALPPDEIHRLISRFMSGGILNEACNGNNS